jgi:hypothetical protein
MNTQGISSVDPVTGANKKNLLKLCAGAGGAHLRRLLEKGVN